jgi:hypothetical protein
VKQLLNSLGTLMLLMWLLAGCKTTNETERPRDFTVVAISGEASYQTADSDQKHAIRNRDHILPGFVITTGAGVGNYLDINDGEMNFVGNGQAKFFASNLRIYENSALKLEKATVKRVAGKKIEDTRLRLLKGRVLAYTGTPASPAQKVDVVGNGTDKSYYEITSSKFVARLQEARCLFSASGYTIVFSGAATLEFTDSGEAKKVPFGHLYDPATGNVSEFDYNSHPEYLQIIQGACPIVLPPEPKPFFEVPRRPF